MKKNIIFIFMILLVCSLHGKDKRSSWEFGLTAEASAGNSIFPMSDFMRTHIRIDPHKLAEKDVLVAANGRGEVFFNAFSLPRLDLGGFVGVDMAAGAALPREAFQFITNTEGYLGDFGGSFAYGGSVFVDIGSRATIKPGKWTITVSPAFYFPVVYVPGRKNDFHINNTENLSVTYDIEGDIYYSFLIENDEPVFRFGEFLKTVGLDLSIEAEFKLFPFLNIGGSLVHIPVVPSRLYHGTHFNLKYDLKNKNLLEEITDPNADGKTFEEIFEVDTMKTEIVSLDSASFLAFRPLRFSVFGAYMPFRNDLLLIRASAGFSVLTIYGYDKACFNMELKGVYNHGNLFSVSLTTARIERIWRHEVDFNIDFRWGEFTAGLGFQAPTFADSFRFRGLGVFLGVCFGR